MERDGEKVMREGLMLDLEEISNKYKDNGHKYYDCVVAVTPDGKTILLFSSPDDLFEGFLGGESDMGIDPVDRVPGTYSVRMVAWSAKTNHPQDPPEYDCGLDPAGEWSPIQVFPRVAAKPPVKSEDLPYQTFEVECPKCRKNKVMVRMHEPGDDGFMVNIPKCNCGARMHIDEFIKYVNPLTPMEDEQS